MAPVVTRTVRSSNPDALVPLRALAAALGLSSSSSSDGGGGALAFSSEPLPSRDAAAAAAAAAISVEMEIRIRNPFDSASRTSNVRGLAGVARAMCRAVPEAGMWGEDGAEGAASVEGWVETASTELTGAAFGDRAKEPQFKSLAENFGSTVDRHLSKSKSPFLVGTSATAADVVGAILLAIAAQRTGAVVGGKKSAEWCGAILGNGAVKGAIGDGVKAPGQGGKGGGDDGKEAAPVAAAPSPAAAAPAAAGDAVDLSSNPLVQKLDSLGIPHRTYSHVACMSADDLVSNVAVPGGETHTKNVLFKDKKHGMFLVTTRTDADVNTKELGKALGLKGKTNLRLAAEDLLMEKLGCKKGCVGPLAIVNNSDKDVKLVMDEGLYAAAKIHSHPMTNDASTVLEPSDLKKYFAEVGVEPEVLPFPTKKGGDDKAKWAGKAPASRPQEAKKEKSKDKKSGGKKGETMLALQWKKDENFAQWYSDVIVLSEMISYYDISGCYILRPWSYKIWELVQDWFNAKIRALDVENSYFPLFVSQDRLEKEKDHVEGFAPEVAWVTKSGETDLAKQIAIRPTSETIMYPAFSDWIKSHRDLPLKLNQWSNVVRWEFKYPTPFLRSREFLWQEGHTAHVSYDDAQVMVRQALDLYRDVYQELLAVPVVPGYKTEKEKFAGGHQTTTVEAYIAGSGRAIQGATSHNLGQNFGKMFDISFQDEKGETQIAWQTSWGLTTRTIGVMVMVHGDDTGLVLPPRVAPLQAVIVPIVSKKFTLDDCGPYCEKILSDLKAAGVRAKFDDRAMYNPGWKYNHWEQKGVPIRIEVGPRDIENKAARIVVRYNNEKTDFAVADMGTTIPAKLEAIQREMFEKAKAARDSHLVQVTEWKDFVPNLELNNLVLTPWCGGEHQDWEEWVKDKSRDESLASRGEELEDERTATSVAAKTLCIPFDQPELPEGTKCIASGLPATCWVLWGRSY
eukprot:CAMPEP_0113550606 /NCGR_PEP_ID=MMETSP0015_2-20120614/14076_1 /TAXON_ID=2838 /ORGANISM="Odontella" /LENGTH=963 /DNA_ID=CAMNT_0000451433 /DNA_START=93 /DNA_END=2984 /DNA_ORIENTATION=- /assembly_acc=CAM_ASM_000160